MCQVSKTFNVRVMALDWCQNSFRSVSWERIDRIWPSFAYALILTTFRLELFCVNFHKLITWPLIVVWISFPLSILRNTFVVDGIWPDFAYAFILKTSRVGLLRINYMVATSPGKVWEIWFFSSSGKSQGILQIDQGNFKYQESQGKVREFHNFSPKYVF